MRATRHLNNALALASLNKVRMCSLYLLPTAHVYLTAGYLSEDDQQTGGGVAIPDEYLNSLQQVTGLVVPNHVLSLI